MSEEAKQPAERGINGRFLPGNSGGPGKRRIPDDVRDMLLAATPKAAKTLIDALDAERAIIVGGGDSAMVEKVPDYDLRIKASNAILDRVFGKAAQPITGEDGKPISFDLTPILERLAK